MKKPINMWKLRTFVRSFLRCIFHQHILELVVWLEHMTCWLRSVSGCSVWRFSGILEPFRSVYCGRYVLSSPLFLSARFPVWVSVWVKQTPLRQRNHGWASPSYSVWPFLSHNWFRWFPQWKPSASRWLSTTTRRISGTSQKRYDKQTVETAPPSPLK